MSLIQRWNAKTDFLRLQQQSETVEDRNPAVQGDASGRRYKCRVCNLEAGDDAFCPECLALTMEPIR